PSSAVTVWSLRTSRGMSMNTGPLRPVIAVRSARRKSSGMRWGESIRIESFVTGASMATRSSSWNASLLVSERRPPGDRYHRRVADVGGGDPGDEIRRAGSGRHQARRGQPGHARQAVGHEGRALLVAHVDVLDALVVVEHVEDVEERRAHDPEHVAHLLDLQQLDDGLARSHVAHDSPSWSGGALSIGSRMSPRPSTEGWQRNVWALTLCVFIAFVGFQFFNPFLPLYVREL